MYSFSPSIHFMISSAAVWRDKTGFWLSQKRLEKEKFPQPERAEEVEEPGREQLEMLLTGIDFWKAPRPARYGRAG
jgi:transposase